MNKTKLSALAELMVGRGGETDNKHKEAGGGIYLRSGEKKSKSDNVTGLKAFSYPTPALRANSWSLTPIRPTCPQGSSGATPVPGDMTSPQCPPAQDSPPLHSSSSLEVS